MEVDIRISGIGFWGMGQHLHVGQGDELGLGDGPHPSPGTCAS